MTLELLNALLRARLDAVLVGVIAVGACVFSHRYVQRRTSSPNLSRQVTLATLALALLAAALAEWFTVQLDAGAGASLTVLLVARSAVFGAALLIGGLLHLSAIRFALLRAELRAHADTERQLEQARLAADAANRAKSDFLAVMSHEIRTPLNAVMGFANLLSESRLDEVQRGYLGTITSEGSRLTSLINDILDLTKIEEGRLALERMPFAPVETAAEVMRLLSSRALERKLDLRFEAQVNGPLLVAGDSLRFRQVIVNLVDNAIKFTPGGSVTLFLSWQAATKPGSPGKLGIRVVDTGIGIVPEKLGSLFQMFMQADPSMTRRYGGTGLGLAICQRLVRLMGGEIEVSSERGRGSEFSFTLPFVPLTAANVPTEDEPEAFVIAGRTPRVLVVDDMETNRFLLEVYLRRMGFAPQLAAGGEEAIRLATTQHFDAILMDLQMPDIDGFTAVQRIRASETDGHRTPIIALTASIGKDVRTKCLAAGMDEHLTKPLDLRRFRAVLTALLSDETTAPALATVPRSVASV